MTFQTQIFQGMFSTVIIIRERKFNVSKSYFYKCVGPPSFFSNGQEAEHILFFSWPKAKCVVGSAFEFFFCPFVFRDLRFGWSE